MMSEIMLRLPEVIAQVKLSRSTIYRRIEDGTFPRPRALGAGCVRWLQSEIDQWIDTLPVAADLTD
ncbi:AlpA family transcriptional regulator [Acidiphilium multivorum]|nr:AlpA family transcriptional regulator [Acidiphilium multivorum]